MSGFLVDTNVISEVLRPAPDARVVSRSQNVPKDLLFLSVVSMGELRKGLTMMPSGARRTQLEKSIEELMPRWFAVRILPMTQIIAERWGVLEGQRQLLGRPIQAPDAQIAATALEHGLTLVTRNVKDFDLIGVKILNPWDW
jgi:toxin FitB